MMWFKDILDAGYPESIRNRSFLQVTPVIEMPYSIHTGIMGVGKIDFSRAKAEWSNLAAILKMWRKNSTSSIRTHANT